MTPILQLESFFLTRLHVDWNFPNDGGTTIEIRSTQNAFDYEVGTHKEEPNRRLLRLKFHCQEYDAKENKVGHCIDCEMVGIFSFTEATPKGKEEAVVRINGINMLYGALRGILATLTGAFPGGRYSLPSIMPQEIVNDVETRRAATKKNPEETSIPAQTTRES